MEFFGLMASWGTKYVLPWYPTEELKDTSRPHNTQTHQPRGYQTWDSFLEAIKR